MSLRSLQSMKMESFVMPAWMAGIQVPKDVSRKTSMLIWIPALHAGMTPSRGALLKLTEAPWRDSLSSILDPRSLSWFRAQTL